MVTQKSKEGKHIKKHFLFGRKGSSLDFIGQFASLTGRKIADTSVLQPDPNRVVATVQRLLSGSVTNGQELEDALAATCWGYGEGESSAAQFEVRTKDGEEYLLCGDLNDLDGYGSGDSKRGHSIVLFELADKKSPAMIDTVAVPE